MVALLVVGTVVGLIWADTGNVADAIAVATNTVSGVGIVLLLAIAFGNFRNLVLVLANLPFALAGGVLAVFFSGGGLATSTALNLLILPTLALRFGRFEASA